MAVSLTTEQKLWAEMDRLCNGTSHGEMTAVEVELSLKQSFELAENLIELVRGEDYLRAKADYG